MSRKLLVNGSKREVPRGISIDRGYLVIRLFKDGKLVYREHVGPETEPGILSLATSKLNAKREELRTGKLGLELKPKRITVNTACDLYMQKEGNQKKAINMYKLAIARFKEKFGLFFFDSLNHTHTIELRRWLASLVNKKHPTQLLQQNTINRFHTVWTRLFNFFYEMKRIKQPGFANLSLPEYNPGTPVKSLKETHKVSENRFKRRRVVTPDEFIQFCAVATERVKKICFAAIVTALRPGDLRRLNQTGSIDQSTGTAYGIQGKVDREFDIPLTTSVQALLGSLDYTNFRKEFEAARKDSGLTHFWFRDLRKSGPGIMRQLNYDVKSISEILGHADTHMTDIYIPPSDKEKQAAVEAVSERFLPGLKSDVNTVVTLSKSNPANIKNIAINQ